MAGFPALSAVVNIADNSEISPPSTIISSCDDAITPDVNNCVSPSCAAIKIVVK
uniref:hypothetical protein n=1 Tax=Colwellia sp. MB3u-41 TaxID=2759811 RepID=UPI002175627C|nr:hypothetical protein [Colwellia sp. MB3u-28]